MIKREQWGTVKDRIRYLVSFLEGADRSANNRFGERIGKPGKTIAEWVNPRRSHKPNKLDLEAISQAYGVRMDYLLYDIGEPFEIDQGKHTVEYSVSNSHQSINIALLQSDLHKTVETMDRFSRIMERQQTSIEKQQACIERSQETIDKLALLLEKFTGNTSEERLPSKPQSEKKTTRHPHRV